MPQGESLTEGWEDERWEKREIGGKEKEDRDLGTQCEPPVWEGSRTLGLFQVHEPMNFVSLT